MEINKLKVPESRIILLSSQEGDDSPNESYFSRQYIIDRLKKYVLGYLDTYGKLSELDIMAHCHASGVLPEDKHLFARVMVELSFSKKIIFVGFGQRYMDMQSRGSRLWIRNHLFV